MIDVKTRPNWDNAEQSAWVRYKRGVIYFISFASTLASLASLLHRFIAPLPTRLFQQLLSSLRLPYILHDDGHLYGQCRLLSSIIPPYHLISSIQEAHKS